MAELLQIALQRLPASNKQDVNHAAGRDRKPVAVKPQPGSFNANWLHMYVRKGKRKRAPDTTAYVLDKKQ